MSDPAKPTNTSPDDICPRPHRVSPRAAASLSPPIFLGSVYRCESPDEADRMLSGQEPGYVYARDGHPNADILAERCRELHGAERAAVAASGMAAMALAMLSQTAPGDHLVVSQQLYGKSLTLLAGEAARLGLTVARVDTCDLAAVGAAMTDRTRLVVCETITNPILRVSDLAALAEIAESRGAALLVDNTFASPAVCRPNEFGAHLVLESLTKIMNGHSDVVLGMLCGAAARWDRVPQTLSTWGFTSSPFDCWLALRGLGTLAVRAERASANALALAEWLASQRAVEAVHYPGLATHVDHALARRQFGECFGAMVTLTLRGGRAAAERFIAAAREVPFCPSLGEISTTLSHPASTSHRALAEAERAALGISPGTLRVSVGIESSEHVIAAIGEGLLAAAT